MGVDAWLTLLTIVAMTVAMIKEWLSPAAAVVAATATVHLAGVVEAEDALSGLSSPAPVTVAGLYVVAAAVSNAGLLEPLMRGVLGPATGRRAVARLLVPAASASAFVANTPIVAMLVPPVVRWADSNGESPSRFLLPLSYASILGGSLTVVGTSTNLVAAGLVADAGLGELGLFAPAVIAGPVVAVGLVLLVALAPALVAPRRPPRAEHDPASRPYTVRMEVVAGGPLDGRTVTDGGLRHLDGVYLAEIDRGSGPVAPVAPDRRLSGGDQLVFVGDVDRVVDLQRIDGLAVSGVADDPGVGARGEFHEVVVGPGSTLVGRSIRDADFRARHQGVVVAVHRAGERVEGKLGDVVLGVGDALLLLTGPDFSATGAKQTVDFLLVNRLGPNPAVQPARSAPIVLAALAAIVVFPALGLLSVLRAVIVAIGALVAARVVRPRDVLGSVNINVVVMIAAALGLGRAVAVSGLGAELADVIVDATSGLGRPGAVVGVLVAAMVLTEVITNAAAVALVVPTALTVAQSADVDPKSMIVGVAVAASASFLTPIGYQTNTMVFGPGRYRFADYLRLGAPLWAVALAGTTLMVLATG